MPNPEEHYRELDALVDGGGPVPGGTAGLLRRVCAVAVQRLSASGAGVSLMTDDGVRGVTAASDPDSAHLEELQFVLGEGPCVDAYGSRRPVLVPDLADGAMARWPAYGPTVHRQGVRALFAFPLQVGAARLGVLDVFRDRAGALSPDQLSQAVLLADIAVTALLDRQERNGRPADRPDDAVLVDRAELFQAQGMVMVQLGISLSEAMARIRAYAYAENRRLGEVAHDIVSRRLRLDSDTYDGRPGG
jgi:hypothetical protein